MQPTLGAQIPGCRRWMGVPPLFDPVPPPSPSFLSDSVFP